MRDINIKSKLLILILIVIVPLTTLQFVRIGDNHKDRIQSELRANQELAEAISTSFMNYVENIWNQELVIGMAFANNQFTDVQAMEKFMKDIVDREKTILRYSWIDSQGVVIASTDSRLRDESLKYREHFQCALRGKEKIISDLHISIVGDAPVLVVSRGIYKDGKLFGVIAGAVDVHRIEDNLPKERIGKDSKFGLIDRNGMVVYRSGSPDIPFEKRLIPDVSPAWRALKGEVVKTYNRHSSFSNVHKLGVDIPISKIGWSCYVTTPLNTVLSKHIQNTQRDIMVLGIVVLASIFLAIVFGNTIIKPIRTLQNTAKKIGSGDFSVRTNIKGKDEISITAEAFDNMIGYIEEYDKLKNQFFSTISHELKTPLNIVLGSVQLLKVHNEENKNSIHHDILGKHIRRVQQNCYRLLRLVNNLIDITKLEAGFLNMNFRKCNIVSIVEDIALSVADYMESKDVKLIFDTDIEEKIITCDPDKIERIMLNLLSNAVKFNDKKGMIGVNIYDRENSVIISVEDNGIGIPHDKQNVIFDRFGQVDSSLSRKAEGSGIGLSLVKVLVEAHGGNIAVKSEVGKGSQFIIELPVWISDDEEIENEECDLARSTKIERINVEFSDIYS